MPLYGITSGVSARLFVSNSCHSCLTFSDPVRCLPVPSAYSDREGVLWCDVYVHWPRWYARTTRTTRTKGQVTLGEIYMTRVFQR